MENSEQLDEAVAEYFRKNPNGNHPNSAPETIRFIEEQKAENEKIWAKLENLKDNKVGYKMFWIIIGFLVTLMTSMLGLIYSKVEDTYQQGSDTKQTVSEIQGKLTPYDIEFK
jgi:hypothetical protein